MPIFEGLLKMSHGFVISQLFVVTWHLWSGDWLSFHACATDVISGQGVWLLAVLRPSLNDVFSYWKLVKCLFMWVNSTQNKCNVLFTCVIDRGWYSTSHRCDIMRVWSLWFQCFCWSGCRRHGYRLIRAFPNKMKKGIEVQDPTLHQNKFQKFHFLTRHKPCLSILQINAHLT